MKVLFVSTLYYPNGIGGAEQTVKLLAEGLVRAGDEAVVVSLASDRQLAFRVVEGVRAHYVPLFNLYFPYSGAHRPSWARAVWQLLETSNPVMAARLGALVDREAPDLVHVHNASGFSCAIWAQLAKRGVPVVQTLHDRYTVCSNSAMHRNGHNCTKRCLHCRILCAPRLRLSRKVDALTTVSAHLWQRISANAPGAFAGVALRRVIHGCNEDVAPKATVLHPDPTVPLRLGFLGRLQPIKGVEVLLKAAERIGPQKLQVRVGGTGETQYESQLRERFAGPGVEFLGHVAAADFLSDIDFLVAPSIWEEALPRVVHEAFAYGVPVIASAIGGFPEMISHGVTGFMVPPGDVAALQALIQHLIDTPPDWRLLSSACLRESKRFAFERIFCQYRDIWQDTLTAHAAKHSANCAGDSHETASAMQSQRFTP